VLTLADALARAKENSSQFQAAVTELGVAREDRYQARAALLPGVDYNNSFIYTQGNGTATGRYVGSNGVHEYISQGAAHEQIGAAEILDYQRTAAAHALAKARAEIAARGLTVTVVQSFYGLLAAQARSVNAERANNEGQHFLDLSRKLEEGGEVAHSDTIKAQIQANDLKRAWDDAKLAEQNARLSLAVLLFPNFFQDFSLVNDLSAAQALPPMNELQQMAAKNNPELQAAFAALTVANKQVGVAKAGYLPSLSVGMFYGIDANQFAKRAPDGTENLGYAGAATLNIPVWNWGATQSKVRQAEFLRHQAQVELSAAQRQAVADLQSFYSEAQVSYEHLQVLKQTSELAERSLHLTNLRYEAGEASALEVVDAQNTLTSAGNSYHDGELRYHLAIANLQTLTGAF
jgi:outer membrane protein TolC